MDFVPALHENTMKHTSALLLLAVFSTIIVPSVYSQGQPIDPARRSEVLSSVLIKSTLTALNHGNITGNYTVLRELGSPVFKENYRAFLKGLAKKKSFLSV